MVAAHAAVTGVAVTAQADMVLAVEGVGARGKEMAVGCVAAATAPDGEDLVEVAERAHWTRWEGRSHCQLPWAGLAPTLDSTMRDASCSVRQT